MHRPPATPRFGVHSGAMGLELPTRIRADRAIHDDEANGLRCVSPLRWVGGVWLLQSPSTNQATDRAQRDELRVRSMVPYRVSTLEEQATAAIGQIRAKGTALEQYIGMASLHDRNEVLVLPRAGRQRPPS